MLIELLFKLCASKILLFCRIDLSNATFKVLSLALQLLINLSSDSVSTEMPHDFKIFSSSFLKSGKSSSLTDNFPPFTYCVLFNLFMICSYAPAIALAVFKNF